MEPSPIVQSRFTSTSGLFRQLAKSHYNELGRSDPNSRKTQIQWIKSIGFPQSGKPKEKRREGTPRMPSPAMASSPKLQRMGTATIPGKKQRTRSGEPTGSYPGCSPPPSPGARLVRSPVAMGDTGGHDAGRLRSRRKVRRSDTATFDLQHDAPARAGTKECQGNHRRDMVTYHTPWKGNQWSSSPNLAPRHPGSSAPAHDSRKEYDSRCVSEEDPPPCASILLAPEK